MTDNFHKDIQAVFVSVKEMKSLPEEFRYEIEQDFHICNFPVTQELWEQVMKTNPSYFKGSRRPIESISWEEITADFLPRLNGLTNDIYHLPSEKEWEFAAKGGIKGIKDDFIYAGSNNKREVAWYSLNADGNTKPVGLKKENQLGIFDMSGNVWEWCRDNLNDENNDLRVIKGGGCSYDDYESCKINFRMDAPKNSKDRYLGFRLIRY